MTRGEKAKELFKSGYNCAQAVLLAFADELNIEEDKLALIASSFGGGVAHLREVCGAISGMCMVMGLKKGFALPKSMDEKNAHYIPLQKMIEEFKESTNSIICRELLGLTENKNVNKLPCPEMVKLAADITEKHLK